MDVSPPPPAASRGSIVARWTAWSLLWLAGAVLTGVSALHLLADSHRWDARVSLPVHGQGPAAFAFFRTLQGGAVNLLATSLVHQHAGRTPFRGAISIRILDDRGGLVRAFVLGRDGTPHEQTVDSSWTTLGQLNAPRLWSHPWRLEARVESPDPQFPAAQIDVLLRRERRDLGMGGMVYYVTIFIGLFIAGISLLLAFAWRQIMGRAPLAVSSATLAAAVLLLALG